MDRIKDRRRTAPVCVKCGTCQTVCPVFSVRPEESSTARGKMAMAEGVAQGYLEESDIYRSYLERCLLCGACQESCPNEVRTLDAMIEAREKLAGNLGIKPGKKMIIEKLVADPHHLDLAMKAGRNFQDLVFKRIPEYSGIRRRIPLPLIAADRNLPPLADAFFTDSFRGQVRSGQGPRVGIFAGCMINYFYPQTGRAMVDLLGEFGASVQVPAAQVCCGMPALTSGAREVVRDLALRNLEAFEGLDLDAIVTGCASCGGNLKENYDKILAEEGIETDRIESFLSKVMDINEFLVRYEDFACPPVPAEETEKTGSGFKVTYHHPCHLGRLQGITEEPVELIRSLSGVDYIPMEESSRCCGMGGSFSLQHYDIAREVNDRKVARIIETGADAVITSCPACILHIRDGLIRNGRADIEVLHIAQLLERFCCAGEERTRLAGSG